MSANVLEYKRPSSFPRGSKQRAFLQQSIALCSRIVQKTAQWPRVIMANVVANVASPMSGATVLRMAKLAIGAKASIISKLSVVQRLQPRRDRARTEARKSQPPRSGSTGSYNGQGKQGGKKKKTPKKQPKQNAYAVTMKNSVPSEVTTTSGGEREKQGNVSSNTVLSGTGRGRYVQQGFLALQFIVKCLKAPTLRVSPRRGCILTQIQTIGLRSSQT